LHGITISYFGCCIKCRKHFCLYLDLTEPIEVKAVSLQYEMDSKGYYQPMYHFEVLNHNQSASILIPAIP